MVRLKDNFPFFQSGESLSLEVMRRLPNDLNYPIFHLIPRPE